MLKIELLDPSKITKDGRYCDMNIPLITKLSDDEIVQARRYFHDSTIACDRKIQGKLVKTRNYELAMPQKARKLALKSALSAREAQLVVVKDFSAISEPKTKLLTASLKSLQVSGKVLLIADTNLDENKNLLLAGRNIPTLKMILPSNLNVKDLLEADFVVITESAINDITERLQ